MRKLRVLWLHGYGQSAEAFRLKSGSVRKDSKRVSEWVFANAPHELSAELLEARSAATGRSETSASDVGTVRELIPRTWWHFDSVAHTHDGDSLDASVAHLERIFREEGPFDGVAGFSQGACLALMLASRQQRGMLPETMRFRFVCCFSGFLPHDSTLSATLQQEEVCLPSFHSWGASDDIITPEQSGAAHGIFDDADATRVEHDGGHLVSSQREVRKGFKAFLSEQRLAIASTERP